MILCNSNRNRNGRLKLINYYQNKGFTCILVNFEIPDHVLKERITKSERSTSILRVAATFDEVFLRQQAETKEGDILAPAGDEAEHLFVIKKQEDVESIIRKIVDTAF